MAGAAAASALCMCAAVLPSPPPSKTEASTREHSLLMVQRPPKLITRSITSLNNKAKKQPKEMRDVSFRLQHTALAGARAARSHADHLPSSWLTTSCQNQSSKPEGTFAPFCPTAPLSGAETTMVCLQPEIVSCSCSNTAINTSLAEQLMDLYFRRTSGHRSARTAHHLNPRRPESATTTCIYKDLFLAESRQQVRI